MSKKEKILFIIIGLVSFFLVDSLIVKADSLDGLIVPSAATFYDNNNGTLTAINTDLVSNAGDNFYMSDAFKVVANSSGGAIGFYLNEPLLSGYAYSLNISVGATGCGYTRLSTVNRIGIGGSLNSSKTAYQNGGNANINFSDYALGGSKGLSYIFTPSVNGQYITIPFTMESSCNDIYYFYGYNISSLGYADNLTQSQVQTIINNNFNNISTAVQDSENSIKESISDTEDSINNTINNTFQDCPDNLLANVNWSSGYNFDEEGNLIEKSGYYYTNDYYTISENTAYSFITGSSSTQGYLILYDKDKEYLDWWSVRDRSFTTNENAFYFRISTLDKSVVLYKGTDYSCKNKIDSTNEKLDDVKDSITSEEQPDTSEYGNVAGWLPAGTIDTLINLPLTMLTAINDNASKSCTPYSLPFINDSTITLPCIGNYLENLSGWGNIIGVIDLLMAVFFLYKLLMSLYKDMQKVLSLKTSDNDLGGVE